RARRRGDEGRVSGGVQTLSPTGWWRPPAREYGFVEEGVDGRIAEIQSVSCSPLWTCSRRFDPKRWRIDARRSAIGTRARARQARAPRESVPAGDAARGHDDQPLAASAQGSLQMLEMSGDVLLADGNPLRQLARGRRSAQQFLADRLSYRPGPLHVARMQRAQGMSINLLRLAAAPGRARS